MKSLLLAWLLSTTSVWATDEPLVVVVNNSVTQPRFSDNRLVGIFSMRVRTWPDGTPIKVFVLPNQHPLHKRFSREILNVLPFKLQSAWERQVFSGTGRKPDEVPDPETMLKQISITPGAIGYLPADMVNDSVHIIGEN